MNEEINTLEREKRDLGFKLNAGEKIFAQAFEQYTDEEIRQSYDLYDDCDTNYGLVLTIGMELDGKIVGETKDDYLVDIDYKDYIRVEKRNDETESLIGYSDESGDVNYGTPVVVMVTNVTEKPNYILRGSFAAISKKDAHEDLIKDKTKIIDAKVLDWSPAGFKLDLIYDCFKIPAFMPNTLAGVNKLTPEKSQDLIGKTIEVMIDSFVEARGTFIATRKKYLETLITKEVQNIQNIDEEGNPILYTGEITGSADFGIFVEFNECLTGMIHIDNLDDHYKEMLKSKSIRPGSEISFFVKEVVNRKLILTKVWRETLWDVIKQGDKFETTVKDIKKFGALVRLDEETVGLVHNTELDKDAKNYVAGDAIKVKVMSVERMQRKIYLLLDK